MIALFAKELRENLKWALLAMLLLGGAELYALQPASNDQAAWEYTSGEITLCRQSFLDVTIFGCAAAGLLLGLLQIVPEMPRDRWAALLHRPVTRGTILRGKAAAGLFLYALATIPPFVLAVWWVAIPGHFAAPFVPKMILPGAADICMGATYYFAGLALALQRGGWIGLRFGAFLAAVHTTLFVLSVPVFQVAIEAAVLMALALFIAAWGEIQSGEALRGRPWLGKAAFLAVVFYGACGLGDVAGILCRALTPDPPWNYTQYAISPEGVPMRFTYTGAGIVLAVRDLAGKTVTDPRFQPGQAWRNAQHLNSVSYYIGDPHGFRSRNYPDFYRQARSFLEAQTPVTSTRTEQWFLLLEQHYLVGYLSRQKLPFAWLDRRGFRDISGSAAPEGFPADLTLSSAGQDSFCLWNATQASIASMSKRELIDLPLPAAGPIYGEGTAWARAAGDSTHVFALALRGGLAIYGDQGERVAFLPYDRNPDQWGALSLGIDEQRDRFFVEYEPSVWIDYQKRKAMPSFLEQVDRQGYVLHTDTLPPLPEAFSGSPVPWYSVLTQRLQSPAFFFGSMLYQEAGAMLGSTRLRGEFAGHFGGSRAFTERISLYTCALSLFCATVAFWWARRACFDRRRAWAWTGFVFAFGLGGLITFRLAADWPRMVRCPACAGKRPIDQSACPACGADWPAPAPTGAEIFDRAPDAEIATAPF